jgi:hypothetical protein
MAVRCTRSPISYCTRGFIRIHVVPVREKWKYIQSPAKDLLAEGFYEPQVRKSLGKTKRTF